MSSQEIFDLSEKLSKFKTTQDTVVTQLTSVSSDISQQLSDVRNELVDFKKNKENVQNMAFKLEGERCEQTPDGGVTALLLGAAMLGLGAIRRKLS